MIFVISMLVYIFYKRLMKNSPRPSATPLHEGNEERSPRHATRATPLHEGNEENLPRPSGTPLREGNTILRFSYFISPSSLPHTQSLLHLSV
jgi:hypothetical protein